MAKRKPKVMTPKVFAEKMELLSKGWDTEVDHCQADGLMCDLLRSLGYGEGVDLFEDMHKWYA